MKTKLLILCLFINCYANAQLRLIAETVNSSTTNSVNEIRVLDNDIIIAMLKSGSPNNQGAYVSNGSSETFYKLNGLNDFRHTFSGLNNEPYIINNDAFIFSNRAFNGFTTHKAYKLNDGRTSATLVDEFKDNGWMNRTSNNKLIKYTKTFYPSYRIDFVTFQSGYYFTFNIYNEDGIVENSFVLDGNTGLSGTNEDFNSLTNISNLFFWNGNYYCYGTNSQNRTDIYTFDQNRFYRTTKLYQAGNSNVSVDPRYLLLEDNYMYFQGLYTTWKVNDAYADGVNEGRELCYTNGNAIFGANDTTIPLFMFNTSEADNYDGTRGYKAFDTSAGYANSLPIKEIDGSVIYVDVNNSDLNVVKPDGSISTLIPQIEYFDKNTYPKYHFSYNNKLYYITTEFGDVVTNYLYEIDGNPSNVIKHQFPSNAEGHRFLVSTNSLFDISEKDGKAYFPGKYHNPFVSNKGAIVSFDFATSQFTTEAVFENNQVSLYIDNLIRFNNGFVFSDRNKVFSYNVDIRAKHITPNMNQSIKNNSKASKNTTTNEITYNGNTYETDITASNMAVNETIKIELLDESSSHFKDKINTFPDDSYAKTYYKIVSLNDSNHQSTVTLSYNNSDFLDAITNESDLIVQTFENGNWVNVAVTAVNLSNKTFTLSHNFKPNTSLFLKNVSTLGITKYANINATIYPNPTDSVLHIALKNNEIIKKVFIYNAIGQQIFSAVPVNNSIDISKISKGVYLIKIEGSNTNYNKKIIKK